MHRDGPVSGYPHGMFRHWIELEITAKGVHWLYGEAQLIRQPLRLAFVGGVGGSFVVSVEDTQVNEGVGFNARFDLNVVFHERFYLNI